jgi:hypothetical protein
MGFIPTEGARDDMRYFLCFCCSSHFCSFAIALGSVAGPSLILAKSVSGIGAARYFCAPLRSSRIRFWFSS